MPSPNATRRLVDRFIADPSVLEINDATAATGVTFTDNSLPGMRKAGLFHWRFELTANVTATLGATGDRGGGYKLVDLPAIAIRPLCAVIKVTTSLSAASATLSTWEIGLGSTIASGNVAVLGGTAAFEDYATGTGATNITAGASIAQDIIIVGQDGIIDGRSAAGDLHINAAGTVGVATTNLVFESGGTIDLYGIAIAD